MIPPYLSGLFLCGAATLLAACGGGPASIQEAPETGTLDISVEGQTVTKVRAAGSEVAFLEEQLTSIFEDGPRRSMAFVKASGEPLRPYTTPAGWSLVDFAMHPSGDLSVVLTNSREVRLVRLDHNGSVRSDQSFLDPAAATDPFLNYAGGLKDDEALQPALMHDAARVVPLGKVFFLFCVPAATRSLHTVWIPTPLAPIGECGVRWWNRVPLSSGKASRAGHSTCSGNYRII